MLQLKGGRVGRAAQVGSRVLDRMPALAATRRSNGTRSAPAQPYGINPHNENSYIPGAFPDLVWFRCERPAHIGGETLLCDGVEVLANLSRRNRPFAELEPVRYELSFSPAQWQNLYDTRDLDVLAQTLGEVEGLEWSIDRRGKLHYVFDAPQVGVSRFSGCPALRTNVLSRRPFGKVGDVEREQMRSGEPVPHWFVSELLAVARSTGFTLRLDAGDVIVIDNSRFMHGRTPFNGAERSVLTRCGFLRPELLEPARP